MVIPAPVVELRPVPARPDPTLEAITAVLSYADRVRTLPAAELPAEVAQWNSSSEPVEQLQLALALSQLRQPAETGRAQETLAKVLSSESPEAKALHPLARLIAARLTEQRRIEDQLERQNQQLRDTQRRLDQTNERLEALKAIERSLSSRPAAATPVLPAPPAVPASTPSSPRRSSAP